MTLYITSSPFVNDAEGPVLNPVNGFLDNIRGDLPENPRCLFVASDPGAHRDMCLFGSHLFIAFAQAGIAFCQYLVLDGDSAAYAADLVSDSDLIVLAGGHVPTQNRFFQDIGLRDLLRDYQGVVMGISAGSMNCARWVYAQPELPGETLDPDYQRFLPGLDLTDINVCPHYQKVKDDIIDGQRLFEDVTYYDSYGHTFYAISDGSYIRVSPDGSTLFGEAYRIRNGILESLTRDGESLPL